jgi:hypothetical protein
MVVADEKRGFGWELVITDPLESRQGEQKSRIRETGEEHGWGLSAFTNRSVQHPRKNTFTSPIGLAHVLHAARFCRLKSDPSAVPPFGLGSIEGMICPIEGRAAVVVRQSLGQPGAEGHGPAGCLIGQCGGGEVLPHPIEHAARIVKPDVRQEQQELLAADPADVIFGAQPLAAGLGEMPENRVAGIVPTGWNVSHLEGQKREQSAQTLDRINSQPRVKPPSFIGAGVRITASGLNAYSQNKKLSG